MDNFTPYETLAESLDKVEIALERLEQGLEIKYSEVLILMDGIDARIKAAPQDGKHLLAETSQFNYVSSKLKKNARKFLRGVGGEAGLKGLRQKANPPVERWWWYLDTFLSNQLKDSLKRTLITIAVLVIVLLAAGVLYNRFLAPDPATQARMTHENRSDEMLAKGDFAGALNEIEQALTYAPEDTDLLVTQGVLSQKLGLNEAADKAFSQAESLLKAKDVYLTARSMAYLKIGEMQLALADAKNAVALNPQSPEALFQQAKVEDVLGQIAAAVRDYQSASDLATAQNKLELVAVIRINMGMAMQRISLPSDNLIPEQVTPTITP